MTAPGVTAVLVDDPPLHGRYALGGNPRAAAGRAAVAVAGPARERVGALDSA
ncbi:hypothetical protein [Saccharothrix lopnurensis]|uniref:Uncharacterized protein n=1 Tax=Saccharothrix lopnurensis TaxID=1670621 RepID=A0ABW1PBQ4_9PSEU